MGESSFFFLVIIRRLPRPELEGDPAESAFKIDCLCVLARTLSVRYLYDNNFNLNGFIINIGLIIHIQCVIVLGHHGN